METDLPDVPCVDAWPPTRAQDRKGGSSSPVGGGQLRSADSTGKSKGGASLPTKEFLDEEAVEVRETGAEQVAVVCCLLVRADPSATRDISRLEASACCFPAALCFSDMSHTSGLSDAAMIAFLSPPPLQAGDDCLSSTWSRYPSPSLSARRPQPRLSDAQQGTIGCSYSLLAPRA